MASVPKPRRARPNAMAVKRANPRASFKRGSMPMPTPRVAGRNRDRNIATAKPKLPTPIQRPTGVQPRGAAQPKGNLNLPAFAKGVSQSYGRGVARAGAEVNKAVAYGARGVAGLGAAVGQRARTATGRSPNLNPAFDPNNPLKQILKR